MGNNKKKFYAVKAGRNPGIYTKWYGEDGAEAQIKKFSKADFKGFSTKKEAREYLEQTDPIDKSCMKKSKKTASSKDEIIIYTDGGCINNPGPGGYGVVIINGNKRVEISDGFRLTTNNRMELMACIVGLKALKTKSSVVIHSDSKYVVDSISKGWAKKWKANGWMRNENESAKNADLWEQLLELCNLHEVTLEWVKGHAGIPENERCDELAMKAAAGRNLPPDIFYENS